MNWHDILSKLRTGQTNTTRFITSVSSPDDLGPYLAGLANSEGGHIFIGLDLKNYHLKGNKTNKGWVEGLIKSYCRPQIEVDLITVNKNDKDILVIEVKNQDKHPYYYKNTSYIMENSIPIVALAEKKDLHIQIEDAEYPSDEDFASKSHDTELNNINAITDELLEITQEQTKLDDVIKLNDRQEQALKFVKTEHSIRNKKYRELFKVSHKTAHLELIDLVEKGIIKSTGAGRSTCYVLAGA
jgi:predicted HTH transcriptional regulator